MKPNMSFYSVFVLLISCHCVYAQPAIEPIDNIRQAAFAALGVAESEQAQAAIDPALQMPRCTQSLKANPISAATVEVRCPDDGGWRIYVPVRVQRIQPVVVLATSLMANEPIKLEHLRVETRDVSRLSTTFIADPKSVVGQSLKRPMQSGSLVNEQLLNSPDSIKRGQAVTLIAGKSGVEVRVQGKALANAQVGELLVVENTSTRRVVQGRLVAAGEVRVGH